MAPKKRSQTPRHSGVAEPSASVPSQQPQSQQQHSLPTTTTTTTTTLLSSSQPTSTDRDRRRQPRGTRQPISSAQSPIIQDSVSSSRSPIVSDYPLSPIDGFAPGSHSRRESTSTMRTSSISMDAAPTCTPTGRVSKAKKGKRVHACEFPGCGKVFTRAEHRRRHELNHNPEALFPCTRPGCRKAFHRVDLLQRHQERHDLESAAEAPSSGHMSQMAPVSVTSEPTSMMPTSVMNSPHADRSAPRTSAGALSIGSLVHPQQDYRYNLGTPAFNNYGRHSMQFVPGFSSSEDSLFYTPESSQSPVSEYYGRFNHRQSISSSSSVAPLDPNAASPLISGNISGPWAPSSAPPSILPSNMLDEGAFLPTHPYQYPSPTWMDSNGLSFDENYQVPLEYYQEMPQPVYQTL